MVFPRNRFSTPKARKVAALRRSIAARRIQRAFRAKAAHKRSMLAAVIKKHISKTAEKKLATVSNIAYQLSYTYDGNLDFQVFSVGVGDITGFQIAQGVGQHQRIGNQIRIKRAIMRMHIEARPYANPGNVFPVPFYLRLYLLYDKQNRSNAPTPGAAQDFFQSGGAVFPFTGTVTDLTREVNKDRYCVLYQRTFKMGYSTTYVSNGYQPNPDRGDALISAQGENFGAPNPDFKPFRVIKINYSKFLPKLVKFNDANNNDPSTRGVYLFMHCIRADGDGIPSGWSPNTQVPARITYTNTLEFIDV